MYWWFGGIETGRIALVKQRPVKDPQAKEFIE
jgi:hypothetical protein